MNKKKIKLLVLIWKRGMNQTTLAKKAGISESRISRILNSHSNATSDELETLSQLLSVKIEEMDSILEETSK